MLDVSEQIRECLAHAEACAQRAALEPDPQLRCGFLDLAERWLRLARSLCFCSTAYPNLDFRLSRV
jgi:hypothetical protein